MMLRITRNNKIAAWGPSRGGQILGDTMRFRDVMLGSTCGLALLGTALADEAVAPNAAATAQHVAATVEPAERKSVEKVTVTATRQKRRVDEVPATVTVITAKEIEDNLATDVKDLVRFEPGVSVRSQPRASRRRAPTPVATATRASTFAALRAIASSSRSTASACRTVSPSVRKPSAAAIISTLKS